VPLKLILAVAAFSSIFAASFRARAKRHVYSLFEPPPNLIETKMVRFLKEMSGEMLCQSPSMVGNVVNPNTQRLVSLILSRKVGTRDGRFPASAGSLQNYEHLHPITVNTPSTNVIEVLKTSEYHRLSFYMHLYIWTSNRDCPNLQ
jgi:hypothetical protein